MRTEEQTGRHLLLAVIITVFSGTLSLITAVMAWELWAIPLILAGCFSVWLLHIAELGSDAFYENLCAGLILVEFFFFGVHATSLFDVPAVACIMILALFTLNKKWILHKGNPDKEVFLAGDSRMMRERHAVVSFSYLLYSGDKSISPMKV